MSQNHADDESTATISTSVGTGSRVDVRFKVMEGSRAVVHELEGADNVALDVLPTVLAVAEYHVTEIADVNGVEPIGDRILQVKNRISNLASEESHHRDAGRGG